MMSVSSIFLLLVMLMPWRAPGERSELDEVALSLDTVERLSLDFADSQHSGIASLVADPAGNEQLGNLSLVEVQQHYYGIDTAARTVAGTATSSSMTMRLVTWNVLSVSLRKLPFEVDPPAYREYKMGGWNHSVNLDTAHPHMAVYDVFRTYVRDVITGVGADYKIPSRRDRRKASQRCKIRTLLADMHWAMPWYGTELRAPFENPAFESEKPLVSKDSKEKDQKELEKLLRVNQDDLEARRAYSALGKSRKERVEAWVEEKPFVWLLQDRSVYNSYFKDFSISQADKFAQEQDGWLDLWSANPFACGRNFVPSKEKAREHDWPKLKLLHLMLEAAWTKVRRKDDDVMHIQDWHQPLLGEPDEEERLRHSIEVLDQIADPAESFYEMKDRLCPRFRAQQDPLKQLDDILHYLDTFKGDDQPAVVFFQELVKDQTNKIDRSWTHTDYEVLLPFKRSVDTSGILVHKINFLEKLGFHSDAPLKWENVATDLKIDDANWPGLPPDRFMLKAAHKDGRQIILGSLHHSSTATVDTVSLELRQVFHAMFRSLWEFWNNDNDCFQIAIIGGDLNVDPSRSNAFKINLAHIQTEVEHYDVYRVTNPVDGFASYLKKLTPLQTQMPKIDDEEERAIDHMYVIVTKHHGVTQEDAIDPVLQDLINQRFPEYVEKGHVKNQNLPLEDREFPAVNIPRSSSGSGLATISGFLPTGKKTFLPMELPPDKISSLKYGETSAFLFNSDHLPVHAMVTIDQPAGSIATVRNTVHNGVLANAVSQLTGATMKENTDNGLPVNMVSKMNTGATIRDNAMAASQITGAPIRENTDNGKPVNMVSKMNTSATIRDNADSAVEATQKAEEGLDLSGKMNAAGETIQENWQSLDARHDISGKVAAAASTAQDAMSDVVRNTQQVWQNLDAQHDISGTTAAASSKTQAAASDAVESVQQVLQHLDNKMNMSGKATAAVSTTQDAVSDAARKTQQSLQDFDALHDISGKATAAVSATQNAVSDAARKTQQSLQDFDALHDISGKTTATVSATKDAVSNAADKAARAADEAAKGLKGGWDYLWR